MIISRVDAFEQSRGSAGCRANARVEKEYSTESVRMPVERLSDSSDEILHHSSLDVRQPEVAPAVPERKPLVIQTKLVQYGRMDVIGMNRILDGLKPKIVRGAIHHSALESSASQQHGESLAVVIAPILHTN